MNKLSENLPYVQAENKLDYCIQEKCLPNLKRHGQVIKAQAMTTHKSAIFL